MMDGAYFPDPSGQRIVGDVDRHPDDERHSGLTSN